MCLPLEWIRSFFTNIRKLRGKTRTMVQSQPHSLGKILVGYQWPSNTDAVLIQPHGDGVSSLRSHNKNWNFLTLAAKGGRTKADWFKNWSDSYRKTISLANHRATLACISIVSFSVGHPLLQWRLVVHLLWKCERFSIGQGHFLALPKKVWVKCSNGLTIPDTFDY